SPEQWCDRRIRYKSPIQVSCVVQRLQLVAMKTVLPVGQRVERDPNQAQQHQHSDVALQPVDDTRAHVFPNPRASASPWAAVTEDSQFGRRVYKKLIQIKKQVAFSRDSARLSA